MIEGILKRAVQETKLFSAIADLVECVPSYTSCYSIDGFMRTHHAHVYLEASDRQMKQSDNAHTDRPLKVDRDDAEVIYGR